MVAQPSDRLPNWYAGGEAGQVPPVPYRQFPTRLFIAAGVTTPVSALCVPPPEETVKLMLKTRIQPVALLADLPDAHPLAFTSVKPTDAFVVITGPAKREVDTLGLVSTEELYDSLMSNV